MADEEAENDQTALAIRTNKSTRLLLVAAIRSSPIKHMWLGSRMISKWYGEVRMSKLDQNISPWLITGQLYTRFVEELGSFRVFVAARAWAQTMRLSNARTAQAIITSVYRLHHRMTAPPSCVYEHTRVLLNIHTHIIYWILECSKASYDKEISSEILWMCHPES